MLFRSRWNHAGNTSLPVCEMWSDANPATPADSHPFHTIEETGDHLFAVDAQRREQRGTVVFEAPAQHLFPLNRVPTAEPDPETDVVDSMALDDIAESGSILEQFNAGTHGNPPNGWQRYGRLPAPRRGDTE